MGLEEGGASFGGAVEATGSRRVELLVAVTYGTYGTRGNSDGASAGKRAGS